MPELGELVGGGDIVGIELDGPCKFIRGSHFLPPEEEHLADDEVSRRLLT